MKAREYFEGIRDEAVKIRQASDMLDRLKAKEGPKAQSLAPSSGHGSGDPMDAVASRIDFEERLRARIAASKESVKRACDVLYGPNNDGGLAKLKGTRYADAICMGYVQAMSWDDVAEIMQCQPRWCQKLCDVGFVYIDNVGWANVRNAR